MDKPSGKETLFFLAIGVITVLSGLYLIWSGDYVIGVSGSIVGVGLTWMNFQKMKGG